MKKTAKISLMLILTLLLALLSTGCMRADYAVKVNWNGTADLNYKITMENEIYQAGYGEFMQKNYEEEGFTVEAVPGEAETVLNISATIDNGKDVVLYSENGSQLRFMTHENLLGKTYVLKEDLSGTLSSLSQMGVTDSRISIVVELPVPPSYSNATATENGGRKLMWNLDQDNGSLEMIAMVPSIFTLILALIVLALLILLIVLAVRKRKPAAADAAQEPIEFLMDDEMAEGMTEEDEAEEAEEYQEFFPEAEETEDTFDAQQPTETEEMFEADETAADEGEGEDQE